MDRPGQSQDPGQGRPHAMDLAVDTGGFHFFDKDTGQAIGRVTEGEGARERREARSTGGEDRQA